MGTIVPKLSTREGSRLIRRKKDLGTSLFGKGRRNVLATLFGNPDRDVYLREIIGLAAIGSGQAQRELDNLFSAGLITKERRGNQTYYRADPAAPIFAELKSIVTKTFGVAGAVREALAKFRPKIDIAFIYGSVARGEASARSDVDVLIVGDVRLSELVKSLTKAETKLKREISPTIYAAEEFSSKVHKQDHFISRVLDGAKIFLVGSEDDLAKLTKQKPAKS